MRVPVPEYKRKTAPFISDALQSESFAVHGIGCMFKVPS
jgi:hypothetical protein